MELKEFTERFNQIVGKNRSDFSFKVLVPYTTISNVQKGTDPRVSLILNILEACPEISAEWLMRGKGKMNVVEEEETAQNEELVALRERYKTLQAMYDDKCVECAKLRADVANFVARKNHEDIKN